MSRFAVIFLLLWIVALAGSPVAGDAATALEPPSLAIHAEEEFPWGFARAFLTWAICGAQTPAAGTTCEADPIIGPVSASNSSWFNFTVTEAWMAWQLPVMPEQKFIQIAGFVDQQLPKGLQITMTDAPIPPQDRGPNQAVIILTGEFSHYPSDAAFSTTLKSLGILPGDGFAKLIAANATSLSNSSTNYDAQRNLTFSFNSLASQVVAAGYTTNDGSLTYQGSFPWYVSLDAGGAPEGTGATKNNRLLLFTTQGPKKTAQPFQWQVPQCLVDSIYPFPSDLLPNITTGSIVSSRWSKDGTTSDYIVLSFPTEEQQLTVVSFVSLAGLPYTTSCFTIYGFEFTSSPGPDPPIPDVQGIVVSTTEIDKNWATIYNALNRSLCGDPSAWQCAPATYHLGFRLRHVRFASQCWITLGNDALIYPALAIPWVSWSWAINSINPTSSVPNTSSLGQFQVQFSPSDPIDEVYRVVPMLTNLMNSLGIPGDPTPTIGLTGAGFGDDGHQFFTFNFTSVTSQVIAAGVRPGYCVDDQMNLSWSASYPSFQASTLDSTGVPKSLSHLRYRLNLTVKRTDTNTSDCIGVICFLRELSEATEIFPSKYVIPVNGVSVIALELNGSVSQYVVSTPSAAQRQHLGLAIAEGRLNKLPHFELMDVTIVEDPEFPISPANYTNDGLTVRLRAKTAWSQVYRLLQGLLCSSSAGCNSSESVLLVGYQHLASDTFVVQTADEIELVGLPDEYIAAKVDELRLSIELPLTMELPPDYPAVQQRGPYQVIVEIESDQVYVPLQRLALSSVIPAFLGFNTSGVTETLSVVNASTAFRNTSCHQTYVLSCTCVTLQMAIQGTLWSTFITNESTGGSQPRIIGASFPKWVPVDSMGVLLDFAQFGNRFQLQMSHWRVDNEPVGIPTFLKLGSSFQKQNAIRNGTMIVGLGDSKNLTFQLLHVAVLQQVDGNPHLQWGLKILNILNSKRPVSFSN